MVKNHLKYRRPGFDPWIGKIPWKREWLPTPVFQYLKDIIYYIPWFSVHFSPLLTLLLMRTKEILTRSLVLRVWSLNQLQQRYQGAL